MPKDVNDILEQALAGCLETKPSERRLFLTTILERVYLALTTSQVQSTHVYPEVERLMKQKNNVHLYINGETSYRFYTRYIKLAAANRVPYTIVNPNDPTPFGLVLASNYSPVHVNHPYIVDSLHEQDIVAHDKKS
ncbi:YueI family protein [Shouchella lonarensis]|uniref:Uncharacterized protein YueI n=1 Tax=Shouchella lonarensis TaxID=1464122 RepID=A0A1G6KRD5_9BACI|nr:YueI family protein [Shouchella lonarensis]SDC33398.1 Uncharacterized protein YueI [Shouchella lonarensis]